ncbi:unnamed protein product [Ectocarpus sp. CCAP 1310/34]|nr:unnamed protein product [Ectocarpus sp. CCAP 1310/34]
MLDNEGRSVRGDSSSGLTLVATNEYGEYDRGALALYGFDMLVEPYKKTTISVTGLASSSGSTSYTWLLVREDDDEPEAVDLEVVEQNDAPSGSSVNVTLIEAGATYSLRVTCRHVRRELRDLTSEDRTAFFSAMRKFYTVNLEAGKEKYGKTFANSKIMSTYHHSRVRAGGRNTIRSAQQALVHDSRSSVQTGLSLEYPRLEVSAIGFPRGHRSSGITARIRKEKLGYGAHGPCWRYRILYQITAILFS